MIWEHKLFLCVWSRDYSACYFLVVFSLLLIFSSHACTDQHLVEDLTRLLRRFSRTHSLCLYHPLQDSVLQIQPLWPTKGLNSVFVTQRTIELCLGSPSLCYALETLSMPWAWVHIGPTSLVIFLPWRFLLYCLLFSIWKLLFHIFCLSVCLVVKQKGKSDPSFPEVKVWDAKFLCRIFYIATVLATVV